MDLKPNAEATRERILNAAMAEFAAFGVAGARVDRIAKAAGCNKNLIYIYFENKERLFTTVLRKHLARVYDEVPFTPDDLPGYAARIFDFVMAHPDLMRLMAWFGLEQGTIASPEERGEALRDRGELPSRRHLGVLAEFGRYEEEQVESACSQMWHFQKSRRSSC